MTENESEPVEDVESSPVVEKKPYPMTKLRFGVFYLVFCAVIFMFWQLLGGATLAYDRYFTYSMGYGVAYSIWSWVLLIVWIIGSLVFIWKVQTTEK